SGCSGVVRRRPPGPARGRLEPWPWRPRSLAVAGSLAGTSPNDRSTSMASESSFDIVSEFDRQEVDNALNQAAKELGTRYDFRGTDASMEWKGEDAVEIVANSEDRVLAAKDVFVEKLVRRGLSM